MNLFQKYKTAVICILIPAFLLLAGNAAFNWHVHKNDQGQLIVHAHPFKSANANSNGNTHSHQSNEYFSIHQITNFFFLLAAIFIVAFESKEIVDVSKDYSYHTKKSLLQSLLPNRAPPVLS
ncbi:hypothetical protein [Marinifilum sp.]|uniref:hypothetical protein n=1 Tax=Marinifilum sp. TaxID=2033137 RepID=UPI003BAC2E9C